jgi:hypothetical protein
MKTGHNSHQATIDALPFSMQHIADALGISVVFGLVEHFGGTEIAIPKTIKKDHFLMVMGEDAARALCEYCPGEFISVPISLGPKKNKKREVDALVARGFSRRKIARELGITQRHVRRMANRPTDDNQTNMFDDWD